MLKRDLTRGGRVQWVISAHGTNRLDSFVHDGEYEQAFSCGKQVLESGRLQDDRPASRQITFRAVAEPSATRSRIAALSASEFALRASDVIAIYLRSAYRVGMLDPLAQTGELLDVGIVGINGQEQFHFLAFQPGKLRNLRNSSTFGSSTGPQMECNPGCTSLQWS